MFEKLYSFLKLQTIQNYFKYLNIGALLKSQTLYLFIKL